MGHKYLLSIDGGGIRGIIPATALLKLEETTHRPLRETFSFVAGTSTGALLSAAIAAGIPCRRPGPPASPCGEEARNLPAPAWVYTGWGGGGKRSCAMRADSAEADWHSPHQTSWCTIVKA